MRSKRKPIVEAVLRKARRAALAHDWARASAQYDLFWEVSSAARGMASVRLSYGLIDWAEVGESYPPALERMRELLRD